MVQGLDSLSCQQIFSAWSFFSELFLVTYWSYDSFFVYISKDTELYTHVLIQKLLSLWKSVYVPWRDGFSMLASCLLSWDELSCVKSWVLCQQKPVAHYWRIDLVVVPWLAFDAMWGRLWRGWWYYDRWLMAHRWVFGYSLWVCYVFQLIGFVPRGSHDIPVDRVLSVAL